MGHGTWDGRTGQDGTVQDMFPIFYVRDIFGTIYKSCDIFLICIKCFKSLLNELNKLKPLTSYYNKCKKKY